jgi:2-(1,2-epoxy-1,2-dihydrophenyl)acetyl-CoA isomerase
VGGGRRVRRDDRRMATELVQDYETIRLEREGPVATVMLNRPERLNAMYTRMFEEISEAFAAIRADDSMRVVVVTGAGRAFCAGGDIKLDVSQVGAWEPRTMVYENEIAHRVIRDIRELPRPVIARVNGVAVGGGCDLALACDVVIASTDASFGEFWVRRGLLPGMGGTQFLPFLVGTHRAKELLFTGDRIGADEAARIGLINRAVAPGDLDEAVDALAQRLANMPTMAIGVIKKMVHNVTDAGMEQTFQISTSAYHMLSHTEDYGEGVAAFQEKREPDFNGR